MFNKILILGSGLLIAMSVQAQEYVPGEVIVKFRDNQSGNANFSSKATGMSLKLKKSWQVLNTHKFQMKAGQSQSMEETLDSLRSDPNVEYAEPNYIMHKQSTGVEGNILKIDDVRSMKAPQGIQSKGGLGAFSGPTYLQTDAPVQVEEAWSAITPVTAYKPIVAVIDTGVDYNHEVFTDAGAMWTNVNEIPGNGLDDDGNGYVDDVRGWNFAYNNNNPMDDENHGTHVAGIILGVTQDIFANPITAAKIQIMPLKFLDSAGSGATSNAIEAIHYAIANGATIINASWGGGTYSSALTDAIIAAYNAKLPFVAAAGNASLNNDQSPTYPANYGVPNVISIAASSDSDILAGFSNYGSQTVHISSPGVSILSTLPNDGYGFASGTSMAAPLTAGIVALMEREAGKPINGFQAGQVLFGNNDAGVGNINGKVATNARVNAFKSVSQVKSNGVSDSQPAFDQSMLRTLASVGSSEGGGGCGLVSKVMSTSSGTGGDLFSRALLMLIILSPFALAIAMKQKRQEIENRRTHDRFNIESEVRISVGSKELVGNVSCISMGGVKIDTEALLENGGIIEMNIMSPDGKDKIQALGKVVWSAEKKSYGVQFCDIADAQSSAISKWTKKLVKAS